MTQRLDCIVIGYNETPFPEWEALLRGYGRDSEAYRDLQYSFVELDGENLNYVGLLNRVLDRAQGPAAGRHERFRSGDIPNLAAVYLVNFLRRRGLRATYLNLFQYEKERLAELLDGDPVCVAITTTFYVMNLPAREIVEFIRERNPRVPIVVGGPLVSNHTRQFHGPELQAAFEDIGADLFVEESQGETTLEQVVRCLKDGGSLSRIPNLYHFEDGELVHTERQPELNSLDDEYIRWQEFAHRGLGATIQTRTARSCAFSCAFCNYPKRAGKLTLASLDTIERELDALRDMGTVSNVVFIDDTFNVPVRRFKEICNLMIEKRYPFSWFSYLRCSNADDEAIELAAESGCKGVFLGIESGSPAILKEMNKSATVEKYARGIERLREHGILTFGSFIVGFPGETAATVDETIDFVKTHRPDFFRAQMWYCEAGTPIEQRRDEIDLEGDGFRWSHHTMDSLEAMDHIDRMFLSVDPGESAWLPQWSFDFWIIPYLLGKGMTADQFRGFMRPMHRLLALEIASVPEASKRARQEEHLRAAVEGARDWRIASPATGAGGAGE